MILVDNFLDVVVRKVELPLKFAHSWALGLIDFDDFVVWKRLFLGRVSHPRLISALFPVLEKN